jgi:hypothetical protein
MQNLAAILKKCATWEASPRFLRWNNLFFSTAILIACCYAISQTSLLTSQSSGLAPTDISLEGTWKYRIDDSQTYADANLDDSDWCLISVPNASNPAIADSSSHPAKTCPDERYPINQLKNKTYWFRKTFRIDREITNADPALFLGAIKDKGWVYWDGQYIGSVFLELTPNILMLQLAWLKPGVHHLAVRISTGNSSYPGIFSDYKRRVSIGNLSSQAEEINVLATAKQESSAALALQFIALLSLTFIIYRSGGSNENFFWLALYFGAAMQYTAGPLMDVNVKPAVEMFSLTAMSIALVGYGNQVFMLNMGAKYLAKLAIIGVGVILIAGEAFFPQQRLAILSLTMLASFLYAVPFSFGQWIVSLLVTSNDKSLHRPWTDIVIAIAMMSLHFVHLYASILTSYKSIFFHLPLLTAILTMAVVVLSAEDYISKTALLVFYGRFIRPGLKQLLFDFRKTSENDRGWIRGKRIPVFKIDIVEYTDSTYKVPYGIKRLYQDLWYTHIDRTLENLSFYDHPEGDGSVYCINENLPGGSCSAMIRAAQLIQNKVIHDFDIEFKNDLRKMLDQHPGLREPFDKFLWRYQNHRSTDFWANETKARFIFHYGWLDEGLWGIKTKSHYSVAGDLLIEIKRLEKMAGPGDFLVTREFADKWKEEDSSVITNYHFNWRSTKLKGIGTFDYAIIKPANEKARWPA